MDEQVAQPFKHVLAREPLGIVDRQSFPSALVHDYQPSASEFVQIHDDRDVFQASPDELPAIDIHSL